MSGFEFAIPFGISAGLSLITSLFSSPPTQKAQEPNLTVPKSNYGVAIPYIYGRIRLSGMLFFPNKKDILYRVETVTTRTGGKGGGGQLIEENKVYGTFAIHYCYGVTQFVELIINGLGYSESSEFFVNYCTFFDGTQTVPWSVIQNREDPPYNQIAYKDLTYLGIEDLPLWEFGNTIPQQIDAILESVEFPQNPDLGLVVRDICSKAGIDDTGLDVTEITGTNLEQGLLVPQGGESYRDVLGELMQYYLFTAVETKDGKIAFKTFDRTGKLNETPIVISPLNFFPVSENGFENKLFVRKNLRKEDESLPNKIVFDFFNENRRYNRDEIVEFIDDAKKENVLSIKSNIATYPYLVRERLRLLIRYLYQQKRNTYTFELSSSWIGVLDLLDLIQLPNSEVVQIYQITMGTDYTLKITASYYQGSLEYSYVPPNDEDTGTSPVFVIPDIPDIYVLDIRQIEDYPPGTLYLFATATCTIAISFDAQQSYDSQINHRSPSTIGTVLNALPNVVGLDVVNTIDIELESGSVESISQAQFDISGQYNLAILGKQAVGGCYSGKFIQFRDVTALGNNQYRLSYLTQGLLGSENFDTSQLPLKFFLLRAPTTGYYSIIEGNSSFLGKTINLIPIVSDVQNIATTPVTTVTPIGNAYKPPAPTNPTGIIDIEGNTQLFWDYTAIVSSYNNTQEVITYEVDILSNTNTVLRTLSSEVKNVLYLIPERTTDGLIIPIKVRIYAISSVVGRGEPCIANISPILVEDSIFGTGEGLKGIKFIYDNYTVLEEDNRYILIVNIPTAVTYLLTFSASLSNGFFCYLISNKINNSASQVAIGCPFTYTGVISNVVLTGNSASVQHISEGKYFVFGNGSRGLQLDEAISISGNNNLVANKLYEMTGPGTLTFPPDPIEGNIIHIVDSPGNFNLNPVILNGNGKNIEGASTFTLQQPDENILFYFNGSQWVYIARFYYIDVRAIVRAYLIAGDNITLQKSLDSIIINAIVPETYEDLEGTIPIYALPPLDDLVFEVLVEKLQPQYNEEFVPASAKVFFRGSRVYLNGLYIDTTLDDFAFRLGGGGGIVQISSSSSSIFLFGIPGYEDFGGTGGHFSGYIHNLGVGDVTLDGIIIGADLVIKQGEIAFVYGDRTNEQWYAFKLGGGGSGTLDEKILTGIGLSKAYNTTTEELTLTPHTIVAGNRIDITYDNTAKTITIDYNATSGGGGGGGDASTLNGETGTWYRDRVNHTGTQSVSTITGLATVATTGNYTDLSNKPTLGTASALNAGTLLGQVLLLTEDNKLPVLDGSLLTGITNSSGGNADTLNNQLPSFYLNRTNHTDTQLANTISDFNESVDDRVNDLIIDSLSITKIYNDGNNTIRLQIVDEYIDDRVSGLLVAGTNVTLSYNDTANTLTINSAATINNEDIDDRVAILITDTNSIVKTYDDTANTLSLSTQTLPRSITSSSTLLSTDNKKWIKASGTITVTVGTQVAYFEAIIQNVGTGTITIAGVTNAVGTRLTVRWTACHVYFDGTSWTAVGALTV